MNYRPLSIMIVCDTPYRHIIFFHTNCWKCCVVIVANGLAYIHFMK